MPDDTTPIQTLKTAMAAFVTERSWEQFHSPKNLAMSLAIEAGELMEHVQWIDAEASRGLKHDSERRAAMGEEMADVFCYLLALCNALDLDLTNVTLAKMLKNQQKYPAEQYRGRYGSDDPNPPAR
jgi:NTP pyrophosphatase (non-canonical NTP hydrolase)